MRPGGSDASAGRFLAARKTADRDRRTSDRVADKHARLLKRHGITAVVAMPTVGELTDLRGHYRRQLLEAQRHAADTAALVAVMRCKLEACERELARVAL